MTLGARQDRVEHGGSGAGSESAGPRAAVLYTILTGAKRHRLEPWTYVRELLMRMNADDIPLIVMGDLNTIAESQAYTNLKHALSVASEDLYDAWEVLGDSYGGTSEPTSQDGVADGQADAGHELATRRQPANFPAKTELRTLRAVS